MRLGALVLAAIVAALVLAPGKAAPVSKVDNDLGLLRPLFRQRVQVLLGRMVARGFRPTVWETKRTPERAAELAKSGQGVERSMHTLGLAVDVISADKMWSDQKFFEALHEEARKLGLTLVRHRDKNGNLTWDWPHVQAMPGYQQQRYLSATEAQRDAMLAALYA